MDSDKASTAAKSALLAPSDQSLRVPCYCEENVWRLAYRKLHGESSELDHFVVFISNPQQCTPMFHQRAVKDLSKPCYWDYHVVLISLSKDEIPACLVYDMDSHLPFPSELGEYLSRAFPVVVSWPEEYQPYFRVIDAKIFLQTFSSDRSHMFDPVSKTWNAPPPSYPCITQAQSEVTLTNLMKITEEDIESRKMCRREKDDPLGLIYSISELSQNFDLMVNDGPIRPT